MLIAAVSYYPKRNFDKDKWKADVETRYEMTDDLVDNRKLIGKTREEVSELLGEEGVNPNGPRWTYYIGFKPGLIRIDPDVLEIEFKDDRVSACWTHERKKGRHCHDLPGYYLTPLQNEIFLPAFPGSPASSNL